MKMLLYGITLLIIMIPVPAWAQGYYKTYEKETVDLILMQLVESNQGGYVLAGQSGSRGAYANYSPYIQEIDNQGNIIRSTLYSGVRDYKCGGLLKDSNGQYWLIGSSNGGSKLSFIRFDSLLQPTRTDTFNKSAATFPFWIEDITHTAIDSSGLIHLRGKGWFFMVDTVSSWHHRNMIFTLVYDTVLKKIVRAHYRQQKMGDRYAELPVATGSTFYSLYDQLFEPDTIFRIAKWVLGSRDDSYNNDYVLYFLNDSLQVVDSTAINFTSYSYYDIRGSQIIGRSPNRFNFIVLENYTGFDNNNYSKIVFLPYGSQLSVKKVLPILSNNQVYVSRQGMVAAGEDDIYVTATNIRINGHGYTTFMQFYPSQVVTARLDSFGKVKWERSFGNDTFFLQWKSVRTADDGIIILGTFYPYDTLLHTESLKTVGSFILRYGPNGELLILTDRTDLTGNNNKISVYPNPATETIHIMNRQPNTELYVYDLAGKMVLESTAADISVAHLPKGIYLYKIVSAAKPVVNGKLVIE